MKKCFILSALFVCFLTLPLFSQAKGLFDFQMKLAKKGNAEAEFKVGQMYATGFGVKQDKVNALKWITKAANQGHETARFELLYRDIQKNGITGKNDIRFKDLQAKAAAENPQAMYYLGKAYAQGVGVKASNSKALEWLNKAALAGVTNAETAMAAVRESQQRKQLAKRRAEQKKHAQLATMQAAEKQKKIAQHKLQLQKQQQQKLLAKKQAEALHKKQQGKTAALLATQQAAEKKNQQLAAQLAQQQAELRRVEAQKQALLKKRAADERRHKMQFESDPCSGKSARFLSTCR